MHNSNTCYTTADLGLRFGSHPWGHNSKGVWHCGLKQWKLAHFRLEVWMQCLSATDGSHTYSRVNRVLPCKQHFCTILRAGTWCRKVGLLHFHSTSDSHLLNSDLSLDHQHFMTLIQRKHQCKVVPIQWCQEQEQQKEQMCFMPEPEWGLLCSCWPSQPDRASWGPFPWGLEPRLQCLLRVRTLSGSGWWGSRTT